MTGSNAPPEESSSSDGAAPSDGSSPSGSMSNGAVSFVIGSGEDNDVDLVDEGMSVRVSAEAVEGTEACLGADATKGSY